MLKFALKAIQSHSQGFLTNIFYFEKSRETRQSSLQLLHEHFCRRRIERYSIKYRAAKLYNTLKKQDLIENFTEKKKSRSCFKNLSQAQILIYTKQP